MLGINFRDEKTDLMLEAVWHTPNQRIKYNRQVSLEDEITPVEEYPQRRVMYSYREIVLHGESSMVVT